MQRTRLWGRRLFFNSLLWASFITLAEVIITYFDWTPFALTSFHGAMISGSIFIASFVLSASLADFKECERLVCDFAATIESMYEDSSSLATRYKTNHTAFVQQLTDVIDDLDNDLVKGTRGSIRSIHALGKHFAHFDEVGVPPNYITKLKTEQASLLRNLTRMNYIQRVAFMPSAVNLVQITTGGAVILLVLTDFGTHTLSLFATFFMSLVIIFLMQLIQKIGQPFEPQGISRDDVSLLSLRETKEHITTSNSVSNK